ncbi:MAG: hypothetical protein IPK07_31735 [Deltaproteobacteria bacterium]|jgi:hypothetical protein|nr:hypothetical protein [Deltaproteobacteria bacterium]
MSEMMRTARGDASDLTASPPTPGELVGINEPLRLRADDVHEAWGRRVLAIDLAPMRYLRDLLRLGVKHALDPRLSVDTLRTQRLTAGVDLPELDTVPVWACCEANGRVGIPFLDLVLDEVLARAEVVFDTCAHLTRERGAQARVTAREIAVLRARLVARDGTDPSPVGPIRFLPLEDVERVCGRAGSVARLLDQLQHMRAEALAVCRSRLDASDASSRP